MPAGNDDVQAFMHKAAARGPARNEVLHAVRDVAEDVLAVETTDPA